MSLPIEKETSQPQKSGLVAGLKARVLLAVEHKLTDWTYAGSSRSHLGRNLTLAALVAGLGLVEVCHAIKDHQDRQGTYIVNPFGQRNKVMELPGAPTPTVKLAEVQSRGLANPKVTGLHIGDNFLIANYVEGLDLSIQYQEIAQLLRDPRVGINYPDNLVDITLILPLDNSPQTLEEERKFLDGFVHPEVARNEWWEMFRRSNGDLPAAYNRYVNLSDIMTSVHMRRSSYAPESVPSFEQLFNEELSIKWFNLMGKNAWSWQKSSLGEWPGLSIEAKKIIATSSPIIMFPANAKGN